MGMIYPIMVFAGKDLGWKKSERTEGTLKSKGRKKRKAWHPNGKKEKSGKVGKWNEKNRCHQSGS